MKTPNEFCLAAIENAGFKKQHFSARFWRFYGPTGRAVVGINLEDKAVYHYNGPEGSAHNALTYPNLVGATLAAIAIAGGLPYTGPQGHPYTKHGKPEIT